MYVLMFNKTLNIMKSTEYSYFLLLLMVINVYAQSTDVCEQHRCLCHTTTAKKTKSFVVDCTKKAITDLLSVTFPVEASELILDENPIGKIPSGIFSNLTLLTQLSLRALKAEPITLVNRTFSGLRNVATLILTGTKVKSIDNGVFADLPELQTLDLSATTIASLPRLSENHKLMTLLLAGNKLENITLSGTCCSQLHHLVLSNNQISALNGDTLPASLISLRLAQNRISSISNDSLTSLLSLQSVDFSSNPLNNGGVKVILQTISDTVVSLKLSQTLITGVEDGTFSRLNKLTTLDLSGNYLTNLTALTLQGLDLLQHLDLHNCSIAQLDPAAFHSNLITLKLNLNRLKTLPSNVFAELGLLQLLDLSAQSLALTDMPLNIFAGTRKLTTLNLAQNSLGSLIASDVNGTLLAGLNLVELHLEANDISSLPALFFAGTRSSLSSNSSVAISEFTTSLPVQSIAKLNLQENALAEWPDSLFSSLTGLKQLNLSSNAIELITNVTILGLPNANFSLLMSGNPWLCNCSLLWFRYWLNESHLPDVTVPGWQNFLCGPKSTSPLPGVPFKNFDNVSIPCGPQPEPQPPNLVSSIGFLLGLIAAAIIVCLVLLSSLMWFNRHQIVIKLHLYKLGRQLRVAATNSRESLLRGAAPISGADSVEAESEVTHDVYIIYADHETDREWVRNSLISRLQMDSYMTRECFPRTPCCTFDFQRLAMIDTCANVLIVVSQNLELHRQRSLLQFDMRYVFDRARKFPHLFQPPIVVQRGSFCSCGTLQRLPHRLLAQIHCDMCHMPLVSPRTQQNRIGSPTSWTSSTERQERELPALLRWPETTSQYQVKLEEFWSNLKMCLGPPCLISHENMRNIGVRSVALNNRPDLESVSNVVV